MEVNAAADIPERNGSDGLLPIMFVLVFVLVMVIIYL